MKTLLVLTDFSKAAEYAALYACVLAEQLKADTIVLYHSHKTTVPVSEGIAPVTTEDAVQQSALQGLKDLGAMIKQKVPAAVNIRHRTDMLGLNEINAVAAEEGAGLLVMGTVNKTKLEEIFLGSSAITICRSSDYPVVLVPAEVDIQLVRQIVFACDMVELGKTIPVDNLKKVLDGFNLPLTILNVSEENKPGAVETPANIIALQDMLKAYNPSYLNIHQDDVVNGIIEFAKQYPATLVLLIFRRHNFMEGLFYRSLTRKLAYATTFPLLILREKDYEKNQ